MIKNKPLYKILVKQAMPKVMAMALLVSVVLFLSFFFFIQDQLDNKHKAQLEQIEQVAATNIDNITSQITNLAKNDLIINSLIDFEQRENYLSVFFQSLKITDSKDVSIGFLDFSGEPIVVNNWSLFEMNREHFNWKSEVFEQGKVNVDVSKHGILIAAPVLYGESPEGAIVIYINRIQDVLSYRSSLGAQVLVNDEYEVMFSSDTEFLPVGATVSRQLLASSFYVKSEGRWWRAVSIEPLTEAYRDVLQLFVMVLFLLMVVIFATNYSARISAKIASRALTQLRDNIAEAAQGRSPINQPVSRKEPSEIVAIKSAFNHLLHDLLNTSLSRDRFESVMNSMSEPLLVLDREYNLILQNNSMFELSEEFGLQWPDDFKTLFPESSWQDLERNKMIEIDYGRYNSRLSSITMQWRLNQFISSGREIGFVLVASDLTSQKQMAFELSIKNRAIDEASTAIVISDMRQEDQPVVYANAAFLQMTGYQLDEVIGFNCRMLQGEKTDQAKRKRMADAIKNREDVSVTLINYKKDGRPFSNNVTLSPIINEKGELTHYIGFQHDVTEQQRTAAYLKQAKERAEQSAKMKSEFLASMSHEIRTPMNGVIGTLGLMLNDKSAGPLPDQHREYALIAKDSAESLLSLINDILDFSKIEAGKLSIEQADIDIASLTQSVARSFKQIADEKQITFELDLRAVSTPHVLGDASRIRQVLNNIIGNALKFTSKGKVSVSVITKALNNGKIKCEWQVEDTGVGIQKNRIKSVFNAFTQADSSTTREFGGTGLGLSISKQLCELMGGNIDVTSEYGKGSLFTFYVVVPPSQALRSSVQNTTSTKEVDSSTIVVEKGEEAITKSSSKPAFTSSIESTISTTSNEPTKPSVADNSVVSNQDVQTVALSALLVEDNMVNQMVAKKMLTECGLTVEVVGNGQLAIEKLQSESRDKFDIIFMDCHMPVMDGYDATKAIRNKEAGESWADIPIVAMTANAMKGDKEKCFEAGMNDYTSKPIDMAVLKALLDNWHQKLKN